MSIAADLHVHSRFSRATSRDLDFIALHRGALEKGIGLVGTGDFTHPGWMSEIADQLEPAEDGLFRLKPDLRRAAEKSVPPSCAGEVRFALQVEISNIYKKDGRTRKNHNLVFVPTLDAASRFTRKLEAIGNVASDGRPIIGLDARDLLEITLESDPLAFLVPAHIWTPWFSIFGSKSGFDSIAECFGDLADQIFAAETGLSSDPEMNRRVSALDRITLISNSDAHSAAKLGREANLLDIELGYAPMRSALSGGPGFLGTIEFFPEEGKYHLDGHRKCGVRLEPEQTRELGGVCPVCGALLTVGVMSRVLELADRPPGFALPGAAPFERLVPLPETIAESLGVGPASQKVRGLLSLLLEKLGPELAVLREIPLEEIEKVGGKPLGEAIRRIRQGALAIDAGYDGEFGTVRIFEPGEQDRLMGQTAFFGGPAKKPRAKAKPRESLSKDRGRTRSPRPDSAPLVLGLPDDPLDGVDEYQRQAVTALSGPLLVVAGPGAGKTRTLVARMARQGIEKAAAPEAMLAIAFTNQARDELEDRILARVPGARRGAPLVTTFHGLGLAILTEFGGCENPVILDEEARLAIAGTLLGPGAARRELEALLSEISRAKQTIDPLGRFSGDPGLSEAFLGYEAMKDRSAALDLDDLVLHAYRLIANNSAIASSLRARFASIAVDEYQDVNGVQAALVQAIDPDGRKLLAIGDPDQAIYGFRGAEPGHFLRFAQAFPGARCVRLKKSYRLTGAVLAAGQAFLGANVDDLSAAKEGPPVEVVSCPTPASEAEQIVVRIEQLIGGTSHFAIDSGRGRGAHTSNVGFGDVAILTRLRAQQREIADALGQSGIPFHVVGEDEPHDPRSQKVAVMTMHASKGREFDIVFVAGVERGLLPLALDTLKGDPEEERRILYVAVTRARERAILSFAGRRMLFGKQTPAGPSAFLDALKGSSVIRTEASLPKTKRGPVQLDLF